MRFYKKWCVASFLFCAAVGAGLVALLVGAADFLPHLPQVFGTLWQPHNGVFGMGAMIVTTLLGGGVVLAVSLSIALVFSVWLVGTKCHGRNLVVHTLMLLGAVPSVVWGLIFLTTVCPLLQKQAALPFGTNFLASCLVLVIMVSPTLTLTLYTALGSLPVELMQSGLALGLDPLQVTLRLLIPACRRQLAEGCALAFGRAVGETTAVLMVSGGGAGFPLPHNSVRWLSAAIGGELPYAANLHRSSLFAAAVLLLMLTLLTVGKGDKPL